MMKRGQFFLVAALIIVIFIVGLASIYTSVNTADEDRGVYDLSEEFNYEGKQVIDYGVFSGSTEEEIIIYVKELAKYYGESNPDKGIIIVYGNRNTARVLEVVETSTGGWGIGGAEEGTGTTDVEETIITNQGESVEVVIDESSEPIQFELNEQTQNFYIIISKSSGQDTYVATN
jgi:hypothetical protein